MKEDNPAMHKSRNGTIIWTSIIVVVLLAAIVIFHYFLRRPNAKLIESVPSEVAFIFQINDNESLVKSTYTLLPYLNEILYLDALPGFQFFLEQFPNASDEFVISGHNKEKKIHLLMSCKVEDRYFKNLLKSLQIDPRNNIKFHETKIYSYGTHYKKFYFVYHNKTFSISDDLSCVKAAVEQLKTSHNILANKDFVRIFELVEKNPKQNWLIVNQKNFLSDFQKNINPDLISQTTKITNSSSWSAFQIRFTDLELILSGYTLTLGDGWKKIEEQLPIGDKMSNIFPSTIEYYSAFNTSKPEVLIQKIKTDNRLSNNLFIYKALSPLGSYHFSIRTDSTVYQYIAFQCDSSGMAFNNIVDTLETPEEYKRHFIYHADLASFYPGFNTENETIPLKYFIVDKDVLIFSDTIQPLKQYLLQTQNNYIESNPYYRFTQNNLPTNYIYEFYISKSKEELWQPYFSEYAIEKGILTKLKIFSFSYSAPQEGIIPTNVFIKF